MTVTGNGWVPWAAHNRSVLSAVECIWNMTGRPSLRHGSLLAGRCRSCGTSTAPSGFVAGLR